MLNTTAFTLTGYRITEELGTVRGIVVRSRSVVGNIGASIQTLFGGDITLYKAVGVGLEDIALTGLAYQNYQKQSSYRAPSLT